MSTSQPRGKDLFERIIRAWHRRSDPTEALTLNQIANIALGNGNSQNAGIVGRTLNDFFNYFHMPKGEGRKFRVNWTTVSQDHPDLLSKHPMPAKSIGGSDVRASSPLQEMKQALDDEIREVKREMEAHPITALAAYSLGPMGDGSFLYEAIIELPGDSELPIPEGVDILLRWSGYVDPRFVDATLLSYDSLKSTIIFEVHRPLSNHHLTQSFVVLPRLEELLKAVQARISKLATDESALSWRLLRSGLQPQPQPWGQPILKIGLDDSQFRTVQQCLNRDITFLWGPPGTGKTHTLGRLIALAALGGQKIVATAIANVAVDQLAVGVVHALDNLGPNGQRLLSEGLVLRFGHPRLSEVSGEPRLFPNKQEIQQLRKALHEARVRHREIPEHDSQARALSQKRIKDLSAELRALTKKVIERSRIVLTTAVQTCIESAFDETSFDMTVVDEASMMPIPYIAGMGMLGRQRFVIAGDFKQLGPIAISQSKAAYDWLHKDAFDLAGITECISKNTTHPALEMLNMQRRMHPEICELINFPFYQDKLRSDIDEGRMQAKLLPPLTGASVVFISLLPEDGSEVQRTEIGSRYNRASAKIVTKLARRYVQQDANVQVGVITPYRAQVALIKNLLKDPALPRPLSDRIKVGTIHAFQGSENDVIIWDLVDTRGQTIGKLYQGETGNRLANVAISRAKSKLIIVGDREAFFEAPGADLVKSFRFILAKHFPAHARNIISAREIGP